MRCDEVAGVGYKVSFIDGMELQILRWLVRGHYDEVPVGIRFVAARMYPFSLLSIRNKVCPFCGRRFRSQNGIIVHLRRQKICGNAYSVMVENVLIKFREVRRMAEIEAFRYFKRTGKKTRLATIYARLIRNIVPEERM